MKSFSLIVLWLLLSSPARAGDIAVTIYYGNNHMTFMGPADDTFCVARSTGLKLQADKIQVPAGKYQLRCPEIIYDPKLHWVSPAQIPNK